MYKLTTLGLHDREALQCEDKYSAWYTYHVVGWRAPAAVPIERISPPTQNEGIVQVTHLLQNYPDPFNPETWIPYELADDADVSITIYDSSGNMIR